MSSHVVIGTVVFNDTENSERYLLVLENNFLPQLMANGFASTYTVVYATWRHAAYCNRRVGLLEQYFDPRVV
jgi:hypothetical protein